MARSNSPQGPPRVTGPDSVSAGAISISLMGGFRFLLGDVEIRLPETGEHLLAFLAVKGRPLRRAEVAAAFWPDAVEKQALANLRSSLWRLVGPPHDALEVGTRTIGIQRWVEIDLARASEQAHRLIDARCPVPADELASASQLLRDDLLPGWYDDWAIQEWERWRQLRLHALEALARRLTGAGRCAEALDAALLCVAADPLRETAHAEVMKAHLAERNRSEAIRAYDRCCSTLRSELGLEPSEQLRALLAPSDWAWVPTPVSAPQPWPRAGTAGLEHTPWRAR